MELNGLANIRAIIDSVDALDMDSDKAFEQIEHQAILLEKYLVAIRFIPDLIWYEVTGNENMFPTNGEVARYEGQPIDLYAQFLEKRLSEDRR